MLTRRRILLTVAFLLALPLVCAAADDDTRTADRLLSSLLSGDDTAAGKLEILSNRGVARADTALAFAYQEGKLGAKDLKKAISFYRRAAESGDVLAQYRLAELLKSSDTAQARRWIIRAAEQGHALAQTYALMKFKQLVKPKKPIAEVLREFNQWADDGNVLAMYDLSYRYEVGRYVPEDPQTSVALMRRAAEAGFAQAQATLGTNYLTGRGVTANDAEAAKWFFRAAEQGWPYAYFSLGIMYEDGRGVPRDRAKAIEWFEKAAAQGIDAAEKQLEWLRSQPEGSAEPGWSITRESRPVRSLNLLQGH